MTLTKERKIKIAKQVAKFVVSSSVGTTVGAIAKNALPVAEKTSTKVRYAIGVVAIGAMAKQYAADYAEIELDGFFDIFAVESEEDPAE